MMMGGGEGVLVLALKHDAVWSSRPMKRKRDRDGWRPMVLIGATIVYDRIVVENLLKI